MYRAEALEAPPRSEIIEKLFEGSITARSRSQRKTRRREPAGLRSIYSGSRHAGQSQDIIGKRFCKRRGPHIIFQHFAHFEGGCFADPSGDKLKPRDVERSIKTRFWVTS
jgi:hypothetical protein